MKADFNGCWNFVSIAPKMLIYKRLKLRSERFVQLRRNNVLNLLDIQGFSWLTRVSLGKN